jgi:hypothetical protein
LKLTYPDGYESLSAFANVVSVDGTGSVDVRESRRGFSSGTRRNQFSWMDLSPGRYQVGAAWFRGGFDVFEEVEVTDRLVECSLVLPVPRPQEHLSVRVLDPEGEPLREARFSVLRYEGSGRSSRGVRFCAGPTA